MDPALPAAANLCTRLGIEVPLFCGAMYPCSNPELVAAVSEAGAIGIVQPISLSYVHGSDHRAGLRRIRELTQKPIGFNAIVERSSKVYLERMRRWVDEALEENVRFFVTALGNPDWVVEKVHAVGGLVFHDVTERKFAQKAVDAGVDGLICVNDRAGGHAGRLGPEALFEELAPLGLPLVCAGGIGDPERFRSMLDLGYAACQLGTRFIVTEECRAHPDYKQAIVTAQQDDIVLTTRITGVPVSVIRTPWLDRVGPEAGPLARWLLRGNRTKHWVRTFYSLRSIRSLKRSSLKGGGHRDYYQAGKSVHEIGEIQPAAQVVDSFRAAVHR